MVCNEKIIKLKETAQHEERIIKMEQKQKQIEIQTKNALAALQPRDSSANIELSKDDKDLI